MTEIPILEILPEIDLSDWNLIFHECNQKLKIENSKFKI